MTKNKRGKLSGIAVACLMVASLVVAGVVAPATILASPDPSVSIVPDTQEVAAGGTFSVDVIVDSDDIPITACNVTVFFNDDLTATGLVGADLLGGAGDALYIPSIGVGVAGYGGVRLPAAGTIVVDGNFVTINFDVGAATTSGTYPLVVEATLLDAGGEGLTVVLNDGEVVVTGVPPGDASVSIIPDTQAAVAGGTFSVGVEVDSAGTPITACNVMVFFNDDLTATGLVGADLLGGAGDALYIPTIDTGEAGYAGVRTDGPIAVDGNFVTINFDVDLAAAGTYPLVVEATLLDAGGNPIAVAENDGEVVVNGGPAASVSIDPFYQMVEAGGTFSVDVVVDSAGIPLTACDVAVFFDTDFTATGLVGRDLLGVDGIDALYIPDIDAGEVSYAGARIDGPIAVNGDFVTINFDVDLAATGTYDLWVEATLLDAGGNPIAVVENDGEVEIGLPIFDETFGPTHLTQGLRAYLCTIPAGATLLDITMTTAASPGPDMDLELYDGATKVIGEYGWIDSSPGGWYEGDYFGYSGYSPSPDPGSEYIDSLGPLGQSYDLKVYAYEAGTYTVNVFYVMPGPDPDPPVIDIYALDATVGVPATITVSATDPSGVAWIWYGVWPDDYILTGTEADYISCIIFAEAPGSEVSLEFIPTADIIGDYYVAAWACDMVGNCTPDLDPEIAYWEVT